MLPLKYARVFILLFLAFLFAQMYAGLGVGVVETSDSPVFVSMARDHPVFSRAFLAGPRSPLTSLVIKAVAGSTRHFVAFQWLLHVCAWGGLAYFYFVQARHRLAGALLALWVMLLALTPQVQIWNCYIMSESLSLTCVPLLFLLLPYSRARTSRRTWIALSAVLLTSALLRDIGAYLGLALGVALFAAWFGASGLRGFGASGIFMPCLLLGVAISGFALSSFTANIGVPGPADKRWVFPLINVIGQRVLPDPDGLRWFVDSGMPVNEAVLAQANKWASSDTFAVYRDPALADFLAWVTSQGKSTYSAYLLEHPGYTSGEIVDHRQLILHQLPSALEGYYPKEYRPIVQGMFAIEASLLWAILPAAALLPYRLWQRRRGLRPNDAWKVSLAVAALVPLPVLMVISYHGDAMDVARHSVIVAVYARLYLVFIAFILIGARETAVRPRSGYDTNSTNVCTSKREL